MPSSLAQLEPGSLPGLMPWTTVHGPGEPVILWDLGFSVYSTTGTQLSQHVVIFKVAKFPYSAMKAPSTPNSNFYLFKRPHSWVSNFSKISSLSELEGPFARESSLLILKMKNWSPAISCLVQGHREQHGGELHLGSQLLQHRLQLHPSLVLIHAKHNWNLSKLFLPWGGSF